MIRSIYLVTFGDLITILSNVFALVESLLAYFGYGLNFKRFDWLISFMSIFLGFFPISFREVEL